MSTKTLPAALTIRALGNEPSILITTPARDLMRDTIDPIGMAVESYLNGTRAVHLFHDHGRLPVGKTVSLSKSPQGIVARFRWLEANPEASVVRDVFAEGVLGASVEFVPVEATPNRAGGMHYAKSVLTGWALTASPANPQCTRLMKALNLDRDDGAVFELADDDDEALLTVDDDAVRHALDAVLRQRVRDEVRRQSVGLLGVTAETEYVALTDDAPGAPGGGELVEVDEQLARVIGETFARIAHREVTSALNSLRGRVD